MDILNYIKPELLVLIPVLYIIGVIIKKSAAPDKHIPLVLMILGIFFAVLWEIAGGAPFGTAAEIAMAIFVGIVQGVLVAGAAVLGNQLFKQAGKDDYITTSGFTSLLENVGAEDAAAAAVKTNKADPGAPRPPDQTQI